MENDFTCSIIVARSFKAYLLPITLAHARAILFLISIILTFYF